MDYRYAWTATEMKRIDKLNKLTNPETFWDDVRRLVKNVNSDKAIKNWQCLAEVRYNELIGNTENA